MLTLKNDMKKRNTIYLMGFIILLLGAVATSYCVARSRAVPWQTKWLPSKEFSHTGITFTDEKDRIVPIPRWIVWYKPDSDGNQTGIRVSLLGEPLLIQGIGPVILRSTNEANKVPEDTAQKFADPQH